MLVEKTWENRFKMIDRLIKDLFLTSLKIHTCNNGLINLLQLIITGYGTILIYLHLNIHFPKEFNHKIQAAEDPNVSKLMFTKKNRGQKQLATEQYGKQQTKTQSNIKLQGRSATGKAILSGSQHNA